MSVEITLVQIVNDRLNSFIKPASPRVSRPIPH